MLPRSQKLCWSCRLAILPASSRWSPPLLRSYASLNEQLNSLGDVPTSALLSSPDTIHNLAQPIPQQPRGNESRDAGNPEPSGASHAPSDAHAELERIRAMAPFQQSRLYTGLVVSAGKMSRTVKVRLGGILKDKKLRTEFRQPEVHMVHDPTDILVEGDVVRIASGWRTSKSKRHVVVDVVAAYGTRIEDRVGWADGGGRLAKDTSPDKTPGIKGVGIKTREEMLLQAERAKEQKWERSARGMIKRPRAMLAKKIREGSVSADDNGRVIKQSEREQILKGYRKIWEKDPDFKPELREKLGEMLGQKAQQVAADRASGKSLKKEKILQSQEGKVVGNVGGGEERVKNTRNLSTPSDRIEKTRELQQEAAATDVQELQQEFQEEKGDLEPDPTPEDIVRVADEAGNTFSREVPPSQDLQGPEDQAARDVGVSQNQAEDGVVSTDEPQSKAKVGKRGSEKQERTSEREEVVQPEKEKDNGKKEKEGGWWPFG